MPTPADEPGSRAPARDEDAVPPTRGHRLVDGVGSPKLIGPGDRLTDAQAIRLHTAVGRLMAIKAAIDAGMSPEEAAAQKWIVHVELLEPADGEAQRGGRPRGTEIDE